MSLARFVQSAANARVSGQMVNILMPKCRLDQTRNIQRQIRDYYESGAFDEITVNRDTQITVKEMRALLLIGLESGLSSRLVGPVTTYALFGLSAGTIGGTAFGEQWSAGFFLISLLGLSCWVDSL